MTDTANSGDGWTQLPVVRLKDDTVMRIADDIGIASHELLSVVVVKTSSAGDGQEPKHPSFISTAPKDVVVEYRPEGHDYIEYEGSRQNPEDICAHFVREVKESIEKKDPI